jgi:L-arabinokinase
VPEGKGVASSAALEVASMMAIAEALDLSIDPLELALLCQQAENLVAGAACGVMDQMTSVFGEEDSLLALVCQPATLEPSVAVPPQISFWGMDSGERHAIGAASYESVRTGAFMGRRILMAIRPTDYLANIRPADFEPNLQSLLPVEISGSEFLKRFGETGDSVTLVSPERTYKVRQPTAHPIYENNRVHLFRNLLRGFQGEEQWTAMGELMYQSHASYSACCLGSPGTDRLVALVRNAGRNEGLYGARITGGGSGGTVAILGRADASNAIRKIADEYCAATGHNPLVFSGSSNGATRFGSLTVNYR